MQILQKQKRIIGYEPKISFEQGIKYFVEWYKKKNQIKVYESNYMMLKKVK